MKKVLSGGLFVAALLALFAFSSTERKDDATIIRTLDGELIQMLTLEAQEKYLLESDYASPEQVFDSWFRPGEFIEEKSAVPEPHELLLYHHTFGQPTKATRHYTYLVASTAISNASFYFDSALARSERMAQNKAIAQSIVDKAEGGNTDAQWVIEEISKSRHIDFADWARR